MGTFSKPPRGSSSSSARLSSHAALLRRRVYQTNPGQVPCWAIIIRRLCIIITIIIIIITTTTTDGSHFIQPLSVKSSLALLCWVLSVKVPEVFCFFYFYFFTASEPDLPPWTGDWPLWRRAPLAPLGSPSASSPPGRTPASRACPPLRSSAAGRDPLPSAARLSCLTHGSQNKSYTIAECCF